jgi:hypothetical protein
MSYITNGQLFDYVTALLHRGQISVQADSPFWQTIVDKAWADSYGYIFRALVARGFGSVTQVPLWDDGPSFQKSIGAWMALTEGGALGNYDDKFIERLDRREELKTVQVTIGFRWQDPDGKDQSPLPVTSGHLDKSNIELHPRVDCGPMRW